MCPECKKDVKITSKTGVCNECLIQIAIQTPEGQKLIQDAINMVPPPWLKFVEDFKCGNHI